MRQLKKIILKGRGFRGGSDEKMRRMWLGLEIDVVGLPPLVQLTLHSLKAFLIKYDLDISTVYFLIVVQYIAVIKCSISNKPDIVK